MKNNIKRRITTRVCADGIRRGGFARRTLAEDIESFHARVQKGLPKECWPWQGGKIPMGNTTGGEYGVTTFLGNRELAHRVAFMIAHQHESLPENVCVLHECDFGLCCNPRHLHLGSHQKNMEEAVERNRFATGDRSGSRLHPESRPRGENNPRAKLTAKDIPKIFELRSTGMPEAEIAKAFGLKNVSPILLRKSWKHVPIPEEFLKYNALKTHRKNNGQAHRRFSDDDIRLARKLFSDGFTVAQICRQIGKSYSQTRKIVRREVHATLA